MSNSVLVTVPTPPEVIEVIAAGPQGPQGPMGPPGAGGDAGHYGSFFDSTVQTASTTAGVPINLGQTSGALGVAIENGNEIVFEVEGTYSLTFSIQFSNYSNTVQQADVWIGYQGTNYPNSATRFDIPGRKSASVPGHTVGTINFVDTAAAGGRLQVIWLATSNQVKIESFAATETPEIPAVPGIILTVVQVMYTQEGPQGPQGETGATGPAGANGQSVTITTTTNEATFNAATPGAYEILVLTNA